MRLKSRTTATIPTQVLRSFPGSSWMPEVEAHKARVAAQPARLAAPSSSFRSRTPQGDGASTVMGRRNVQNFRVRGAWSGSMQLQGMLLFTLTAGMAIPAMCDDDKAAVVRDVLREHGLEEAETFVTSYCWEGVRGLARLQRLEARDIDQVVSVSPW